ncbi:unnamed protein product [Rotaria sp. Silwood2]|nr:unnamed protein product [Rotaria sp. Silwood2]CAF2702319.1 unnamed protein product [Rotaria sp. Silwood2]CAF2983329.1 unnamed protein product [Rotaria sp. Silwood2]CAF3134149.1 unnamed protein product [Rotaria sp. Silwood2]CAF4040467.1 unnamed protein product [Rotaria sp. Silwood2]
MTTIHLLQMETNSSARSKKLPPPPLSLPATNTTDEEKFLNSNQKREQKKSTNNCCLSSSSEDCPHKSIPFTLPASQRPQILETLMACSSTLLVPPPSETKHKKSYNAAYTNQINLLKQRQSSSKMTVTDAEWIDFIRLIIHKPLERELKVLLDNYKMTYFDRVNAPNTTDETIRASLCAMVSEALITYSANSILPAQTTDDLTTNVSSHILPTTITNNGTAKRKRKNTSNSLSISTPAPINSQTKFVISHIIPGQYDSHSNGNKMTNQQQLKQFQKKYSHLFKYIPERDEQEYLTHEGHLKNISISSSRLSSNNNICLMLYDEVISYMDEYDLELSGISIDDSFLLPESILANIRSSS